MEGSNQNLTLLGDSLMNSSDTCVWLTERLARLPLVSYPFAEEDLPTNGIYLFYESGEIASHGDRLPRIVRVGTHRDGNFRQRIAEHYLLDDRKMSFDRSRSAPKDRSIFRKNIGRALLNKSTDPYLNIWNIDFMKTVNLLAYSHLRDIEKEREIEREITRILRENFCFRFVAVETENQRLGTNGLERRLIGTVAQCARCRPSANWLGSYSPLANIRATGLWQVQHIKAPPLAGEAHEVFARLSSI
jgi:hypothetical protein